MTESASGPKAWQGSGEAPIRNVFVTGGTGFVGRALIRELVAKGMNVTALSRSDSGDRLLKALGARAVRGTLNSTSDWADALDGQDAVVHLAAPITVWGDARELERLIADASVEILRACNRHGVKRMIYLSSESVLQDGRSLEGIDENFPYPDHPNSGYGAAKKKAEISLLAEPRTTELIILRPPFIWGDGGQIGQVLEAVESGKFKWIDHGRAPMEMVHVENLVHTIELALEHGRDGQIYFITDGADLSIRDFFTKLFEAFGIAPPTGNMPGWLARPTARLVELIWRLFRLKSTPPLSRFQLDFVALPRRYDISRAKRELGYAPQITVEEGLDQIRRAHARKKTTG